MKNDIRTGWRVVLKAGSGYQVYEESIALLSELSMLGHTNPGKKGKGKEKSSFVFVNLISVIIFPTQDLKFVYKMYWLYEEQNTFFNVNVPYLIRGK